MKKYPLGAEPSEYDPRDWSVAFTNKQIDWPVSDEIPNTIENYDQDAGTCVAQGIRHAPHRKYKIAFGTNFLYGLARGEKDKNKGLQMRPALDFFCKYGLAPLSVDPIEKEVPEAITYALRNKDKLMLAAEPYKGWSYARLYTVDEIKAAIRDKLDVIFVMKVSTYKPNQYGWFKGNKLKYGFHCVKLMGYGQYPYSSARTKEGAKVRNSWGEDWGIFGDCYMTWDDVLLCNEIFVMFPPVEEKPDPIIKPRRTLRKGSKGEDVKEAQTKLNAHGFNCGEVDGDFGSKTYAATVTFQRAKGLVADGIIGKNTWTALDADPFIDPVYPDRILEFVEYLKSRVGDIYVWGAQGQSDITESWIKKRETSTGNAKRAITLWQKRVKAGKVDLRAFDCSGLIMYWLQNLKGWYKTDMSANSIYNKCEKIKRSELKAGDLVFRRNTTAHHVGVYVGDGKVIEAKGRDDGVVMRDIDASGTSYWNKCGRLGVLHDD